VDERWHGRATTPNQRRLLLSFVGDQFSRTRLIAGVVLAGLFGLLTLFVVAGWTQALDDAWNSAMASVESDWLVSVAEWFHVVGSAPIAAPIAVAAGVGFLLARRWDLALAWVAIIGGAQITTTVTKLLVGRPRPSDALVHESSAAYPSGHATVSGAAMAIGLAVLLGFIWPRRHNLFLWIGGVYAVLMALSRTYVRVHWLTDVVGGLALGCAFVLVVAALTYGTDRNTRTGVDD